MSHHVRLHLKIVSNSQLFIQNIQWLTFLSNLTTHIPKKQSWKQLLPTHDDESKLT